MYPFNILKFTIRKFEYNVPLFQYFEIVVISTGTISSDSNVLICIAKGCNEYHSPGVELEMVTSIPIPDL